MSRPLALLLSSKRIGINGVPSGPGSGCKATHENTVNVWRQRLSTGRVGNVPIAVYLLLPPLALEAGRSGTPALRLFDWAVTAHPEALGDICYGRYDVV